MLVTFEGDSLAAIAGEMRAFLAVIERSPGGTVQTIAGGAYAGPALPACPEHLVEMVYTPGGERGGRRFSASYRCARPGCSAIEWLGGRPEGGSAGRRRSRG